MTLAKRFCPSPSIGRLLPSAFLLTELKSTDLANIRFHPVTLLFLSLFMLFWFWQFFQLVAEVKEKREIKMFYNQTLRISEVGVFCLFLVDN